jgi:predicted ATPase
MGSPFRSEIRHSQIRDLIEKVKGKKYGQYLYSMKLYEIRAFESENPQPVTFEFPVTALIGTNGGGKSTILGAAACAYKTVKPGDYFPKSVVGDDTMANWHISYELINKSVDNSGFVTKSARFRNLKWVREDFFDRSVLFFGIKRTVPTGEKSEFKKLARRSFDMSGVSLRNLTDIIGDHVRRILGKPVSGFKVASIHDGNILLHIGNRQGAEYSEFHFGAGESSVIRMVSEIETTEENSLILIEEIENGLHPVATTRMVEYLVNAAERRKVQVIFTTHSEAALKPLPPEAIWASVDGHIRRGRMSIEALREFSGEVPERVAILVEDAFAQSWCKGIVRHRLRKHLDEIGIYEVAGDGNAVKVHVGHKASPAVQFQSLCIIDGDSEQKEDTKNGILRLPGRKPESTVFNFIAENINILAPKLTVACHLDISEQGRVKLAVEKIHSTNRDAHVVFSQLGLEIGWISQDLMADACISLGFQNTRTRLILSYRPLKTHLIVLRLEIDIS